MTRKQVAVIELRYQRGATVGQMAKWLRISPRAVQYRLRNAECRARRLGVMLPAKGRVEARMFSASQIMTEKGLLTLEAIC